MLSYATIGVVLGSTYGLLAVSLLFVYQTTQVLNFAFGAIGMVGAYVFTTLQYSMNPWLALALCAVLGGVVGTALGVATLPVQSIGPNAKTMATLGLLTGLGALVVIVWGILPRPVPVLTSKLAFRIAHVGVTWQSIIVVLVDILVTTAIVVFFRRGRYGAALRAMAHDASISRLVGLPVRGLWMLAWAASTALAVIVMILLLPDLGLDENSLTFSVMVPVAAVVIAGFRSIPVGFGAAFAIGFAQSIFGGYPSLAPYVPVLPLAAIVATLMITRRTPAFERV